VLNRATSAFLRVTSPGRVAPPACTYDFICAVAPAKLLLLRSGSRSARLPHPRLKEKLTKASNWFWVNCENNSVSKPSLCISTECRAGIIYWDGDIGVNAGGERGGVLRKESLALRFCDGRADAIASRGGLTGMPVSNGFNALHNWPMA